MELNFTIRSDIPRLCLWGFNLEIRDGSSQSTNLLGEFCGDYGTGVVRSSGRYMWLKFIRTDLYNYISVFYTARSINETGMIFLSINLFIYIYIYVNPFSKTLQFEITYEYIYAFVYSSKSVYSWLEKKQYIHIKYFQTCNVFVYICMYPCMYVSMYVCMCLSIYLSIYLSITNCRQYCFGLLVLISAVLMLGWR